ncbi:GNAT family N-acetyltransferase [Muricauda ruestringensis]|uniref:GNAT family N-acetyltransferase n=1 Tax=Flagellimonas TaxID=444459 RepID=UPI001CD7391C|nr:MULTISPECIES: GNAT family N-acetyltransferase [Allomuricauda]MCA0958001.1 GNAT family N-acetyltransferase [Allomuricauda ruestringensis]USD24155.1 GNAT family N-acetyltransferase [Allomuricauda aquimarina]
MSKYLLDNQTSDRLLYRKLTDSDFEDWLPFYNDPRSTQYWDGLPKDPVEACKAQFERVFERYQNDLGGMNALILKESGKLIGICGLLVQTVDNVKELEIGYSVLPNYWLKGLASEAARKCKAFAFENNFSDSLISIIHVDNIPSQKVAINNGMYLDKTTVYKNNPVHIFRVKRG